MRFGTLMRLVKTAPKIEDWQAEIACFPLELVFLL